ncbi:addiction module protein [Thiohalomonas denitrificans]|uniref:addiction module protein n=1 Tax=Thiohalomonas denitrificans TaxID=415747 RepID=UPI00294FF301|nr:addiction module protein [Thiohalomonas denitrificans]
MRRLAGTRANAPESDHGKTIRLGHSRIPLDQRIQLVEDLWDSIAELPEAVAVPEWHKDELEKRLELSR